MRVLELHQIYYDLFWTACYNDIPKIETTLTTDEQAAELLLDLQEEYGMEPQLASRALTALVKVGFPQTYIGGGGVHLRYILTEYCGKYKTIRRLNNFHEVRLKQLEACKEKKRKQRAKPGYKAKFWF